MGSFGEMAILSFNGNKIITTGGGGAILTDDPKIADKANLYGVICSPLEVKMINQIAPKLKCFTPGIRQDGNKNDQKRTMNAKQALEEGSDCLIIGRPITDGDPKKNIQKILSSLN